MRRDDLLCIAPQSEFGNQLLQEILEREPVIVPDLVASCTTSFGMGLQRYNNKAQTRARFHCVYLLSPCKIFRRCEACRSVRALRNRCSNCCFVHVKRQE
jgi:hypothetical protein